MADWTDGYVADLNYTYGFYHELTPSLLALVALSRGVAPPSIDEPLSYCELGCGHGFSANLLAAANPHVSFFANDFNPSHVVWARSLAKTANVPNVQFSEASFRELDSELEKDRRFDIIALHGVYSWVSQENRLEILKFIRSRLNPGGLVYVSYNVLPGWAAALPLRRLLIGGYESGDGDPIVRTEAVIKNTEELLALNAGYFRVNPSIKERLERLKTLPRTYIIHEYLNKDWKTFYHSEVSEDLSSAKLDFVGSAHALDHIEGVNFTPDQIAFLAKISNVAEKETTKDFLVNQQFRRDVFMKGGMKLSPLELKERWLSTRFALCEPKDEIPLKIIGPIGEIGLQEAVYRPILDAFAAAPQTLRQAAAQSSEIGRLPWPQMVQAMLILVGAGHVKPCLDAAGESKRAARTRAFNSVVLERAQYSADLQALASPVTGGGIMVDRIAQLFIGAHQKKQADVVKYVWGILKSQSQRLQKDGVILQTDDENIEEIAKRYSEFSRMRLPVFQKLGIL
jgi:SAM-dependent methyltransferase